MGYERETWGGAWRKSVGGVRFKDNEHRQVMAALLACYVALMPPQTVNPRARRRSTCLALISEHTRWKEHTLYDAACGDRAVSILWMCVSLLK